MKVLIVEACSFTRLGIFSFLRESKCIEIVDCVNSNEATLLAPVFEPDLILINITRFCNSSQFSPELKKFIDVMEGVPMYCYIDAQYPVTLVPIAVTRNVSILNKQLMTTLLKEIAQESQSSCSVYMPNYSRPIFSDQEILVMDYWMSEMPNHRIARKLDISSRTVYVHKRHLAQKIKARNRLEFCFIYNFIKYLFWPINEAVPAPLSRQTKEDIMTLHK